MRIVHLNTVDTYGGAARSAYRLHRGLLAAGVESSLLVKEKLSTDDSVVAAPLEQSRRADRAIRRWDSIQNLHIHQRRTAISNTHFSLLAPGYDLSRHPLVAQADIIHLHWVSGFLCPPSVARLQRLGKPLVWTLHDQRPFTGGCHFSAGCHRFETDCAGCPQLSSDPFGLTPAALADSIDLFGARDITVVSPSQWLAECARRSLLFRDSPVEVIPYGLETGVFKPRDKAAARAPWQLAPGAIYFLFGAFDWTEKRKGFALLMEALRLNLQDDAFRQCVQSGRVGFLCFGQGSHEIAAFNLPVTFLGQLTSDEKVAAAYSAADVVLFPSLEDNLPNILLEAMCCGTPVIAHRVGGVPDAVSDGTTGMLVPAGDSRQFAKAIRTLADDPGLRAELSENCRREVPSRYTLERQADRYLKLYEKLSGARMRSAAIATATASSSKPCPMQTGGPRLMAAFAGIRCEARRQRHGRSVEKWRGRLSRWIGLKK